MQLAWLQDLVELADTRSFSRAAENRFVTQPAFGRRIRALEEWVGAALVERTQPVSLTSAGRLFLDAASCTLDVLESARAQLQNTAASGDKVLRIATGRTLARTFLPEWSEDINHRFGPFLQHVSTSGAQEAITRLAAGDVDLLVTYSSPTMRLLIDPNRFISFTLAGETLLPVSAPAAAGGPRFNLSAASTRTVPWLAFSTALTLRGVLAKHLAELPHKYPLRTAYQADSYDAILEMAKRGAGLAWLPARLVREELRLGQLLTVGDSSLRVNFDICLYALRGNANPHVDAICEGLRNNPVTFG